MKTRHVPADDAPQMAAPTQLMDCHGARLPMAAWTYQDEVLPLRRPLLTHSQHRYLPKKSDVPQFSYLSSSTSSYAMPGTTNVSKEILLRILYHAVTDTSPPAAFPPTTRNSIGLVCKYWRRTLINAPSLWQFITLCPTNDQHRERRLAVAYTWLRRGHGAPLYLDLCSGMPEHLPPRIEDLLYGGGAFSLLEKIIQPFAFRIVSLSCILCKEDVGAFLALPQGTFPVLERVNIFFVNAIPDLRSQFTMEERTSFTVFVDAQRLTSARLHLFNDLHPLELRLPWAQMMSLDFGSVAMSEEICVGVLQRAAGSLVEGCFSMVFEGRGDPHFPHAPIPMDVSMRRLRRLRLFLGGEVADAEFFQFVGIPMMKNLRVEKSGGFTGEDLNAILPVIASASASLEQLTLLDIDMPTNTHPHRPLFYSEITSILLATPQLVYLHLPRSIFLDGDLLEDIAFGRVLPSLRALDLAAAGVENGNRLVEMVIRRNAQADVQATPGSSSSSVPEATPRVMPISFLRLEVALVDRGILQEWVEGLRSSGWLRDITVDVSTED
ncbi:unnamed protein product [Cyclocybe aegerita]|uniref:F-box domain-containing protein n=1 Tax=Cyclocybe aegerita TaxID=1973307 RepID=A0A8S0XRU2_CYCAE|nr:unnamed protein product [Cyclocybe aegerita]